MGTHAGVRHVQAALRRTGATHFLKTDFSKFFYSVDRAVLHGLIRQKISCPRHKLLRKASVTAAKRKIANFAKYGETEALAKFAASWRGHAAQADTCHLFNHLKETHMDSTFINTRADLDALAGTPAHDTFMAALAGSVWRLEKDDELKTWKAVQDASTIERFGFALADFADVPAPELPVYTPPPSKVPASLSMRQARLALLGAGLLDTVQSGVSAMPKAAQIEWEFAATVERSSPLVATLAAALGLDDAALDALFEVGVAL